MMHHQNLHQEMNPLMQQQHHLQQLHQNPHHQQQQHQQYQTNGQMNSNQNMSTMPPPPYMGPVTWSSIRSAFGTGGGAEGEPPLLEELGINLEHISAKGVTALNPLRQNVDSHLMDDADLAGPLLFCLAFGAFLLLGGKVHFGYVYGVAMVGWVSIYALLNLMSDSGIDGSRTASVLGYSLLPMVLLSFFSSFISPFVSESAYYAISLVLAVLSVLWCTLSASLIFVSVLQMADQRLLVAYPVLLVYAAFALIAVF